MEKQQNKQKTWNWNKKKMIWHDKKERKHDNAHVDNNQLNYPLPIKIIISISGVWSHHM